MIYQWAHPHLVLFSFVPSNLWEISSTRGEKTSQTCSVAVKCPVGSFPVVLGLHLMIITLCIVGESMCTSKYSAHIFDWYLIRQQFSSVCFSQFLLEIGLTVMSFKWSPECKNMLHGFSPRSPVPSVVSTHLKLSFRWGEQLHFYYLHKIRSHFWFGEIFVCQAYLYFDQCGCATDVHCTEILRLLPLLLL